MSRYEQYGYSVFLYFRSSQDQDIIRVNDLRDVFWTIFGLTQSGILL